MEEILLKKNGIVKKEMNGVQPKEIILGEIKKKHKIIASLTSFPFRIKTLHIVMGRIFNQTLLADEVHLYLAKEQFPNLEKDLTNELLAFGDCGLQIIWVDDDIKPHKKYYYVMQSNPDDIVITLDDDIMYDLDMFEKLYRSYIDNPYCISAMRTHLMTFDEKNQVKTYKNWIKQYSHLTATPSMLLFSTSGAGTLYPPKSMHKELFNMENIKKICLNADDLWLKIMQVMNNTPIVLIQPCSELIFVDGSQEERLYDSNITENDVQLKSILQSYNYYFGKDDTLINRIVKSNEKYQTKDEIILNTIGVRRK